MVATDVKQKVKLIEGVFTPDEASDVLEALIRQKVNFHKVKRLQTWITDASVDTSNLEGRIGELLRDKKSAMEFIEEAKREGFNLHIQGKVEITFTK